MNHSKHRRQFFLLLAIPAVVIGLGNSAESPDAKSSVTENEQLIAIAPPPFSEGIFPCSECHFEEDEVDRTPREVDFHDTVYFDHDEENRWCLDCHDAENRDLLHLASGEPVLFEESYRLCGQCHGEKYRDWRAGIHGRRTGDWNGHKSYLLCAHCHNPHEPHFQPLKPEPAPIQPATTVGGSIR